MVQAGEALAKMQEELGDAPKLNVRSRFIHCHGREFTQDEVSNLYLFLSRGPSSWPKTLAMDTFNTLAGECPFDPVMAYLGNLKAEPLSEENWERLDQWLFNIDDPITARFMQRYAVAAVQRVFEPGCQQRQVPVLLGEQYIGKSELGRALFSDQWYGDGIRSAMDVDDVTLMAHCWAVEFAEFDGFTRKTSAERLKAFISRTTDICRRKYGKGTERIPRRSVFWGTANRSPLTDRTGSTRFCLIELPDKRLPLARVTLDRDAFWRRALAAYRDGFQSYSTDAELDQIVGRNAGYDMPDPWEEPIGDFLKQKAQTPYVTFQEIYELLDIPAVRQVPDKRSTSKRSRPNAGGSIPAAALVDRGIANGRSSQITSASRRTSERLSRVSRAFHRKHHPLSLSLLQLFGEKRRDRRDTPSFSLPMTKQTLSDQFNNVEQRFNSERHIYEKSHGNLKTLEAELLAYTDEYQEMPKQAEYVGEGTWRVLGGTFSAMQRDCECCWDYVWNTFSGKGGPFPRSLGSRGVPGGSLHGRQVARGEGRERRHARSRR